ncbi:nucleotidyltransferase domain-containing protein [Saliphagus sp. GCM10025317]
MGLLIRQDTGAKTLYQINERSLFDADDPFLGIPQAEFREPLKRFVNQVGQELSTDAAILCFGSVARGDADRVSDIDLFVLVGDDEELVTARRAVSEVVRELETEPIDGQRYEFEVFVESPESARRRGEDLQPILQEGIVLSESEAFRRVKGEVFGGIEE